MKTNYGFREEPYVFFSKNEPIFESVKTFYDINDDFNPENLLTRCATGKKKHIYFCTDAVKKIVANNADNVKIINTGVKTFTRADNRHMASDFRLTHEGLDNIIQFIGDKRKLKIQKDDLILILKKLDPDNAPEISEVSPELKDQLNELGNYRCIFNIF